MCFLLFPFLLFVIKLEKEHVDEVIIIIPCVHYVLKHKSWTLS